MHLRIRPERSLSPPSAVICLILFMSLQIEHMHGMTDAGVII